MSHEEEPDKHQITDRAVRHAAAMRRAVDDAHGSFTEELRKEPDWNATQRRDGTWAADNPQTHTPGPWDIGDGVKSFVGLPIIGPMEARGPWLVGSTTGRSETDWANARLIVAAPDLLAAIMNSDDEHWTTAMRAAMKKALGEDRPIASTMGTKP